MNSDAAFSECVPLSCTFLLPPGIGGGLYWLTGILCANCYWAIVFYFLKFFIFPFLYPTTRLLPWILGPCCFGPIFCLFLVWHFPSWWYVRTVSIYSIFVVSTSNLQKGCRLSSESILQKYSPREILTVWW